MLVLDFEFVDASENPIPKGAICNIVSSIGESPSDTDGKNDLILSSRMDFYRSEVALKNMKNPIIPESYVESALVPDQRNPNHPARRQNFANLTEKVIVDAVKFKSLGTTEGKEKLFIPELEARFGEKAVGKIKYKATPVIK